MRKHSLVYMIVIVVVMLILAAPAMAQSRSHITGYYGPGGVSNSHRFSDGNGNVRGDSYYRDWRGLPQYRSYHYNDRGYYNLRRDPDGLVANLGTYGRHSVDLTIDTHRPSWLRDRRRDGYAPYSRRDWRDRLMIHERCDNPQGIILRADPPSSTPQPRFDENNQLLNAEELPEPPHGVEVHHLGGD